MVSGAAARLNPERLNVPSVPIAASASDNRYTIRALP